MDYSRLMMGIGSGGGDSGGGSDNPSVEPTMKTISDFFAEPNLPQQYVETLGAPFGERYVYTIFMQGINVLPDIPSSAEGSELTARVKEVFGNQYRIVEYYYVKHEGEWVADGAPKTISEWTEETESSGGGGNVFLVVDENNYLVAQQDHTSVSVALIANWIQTGVMPWLADVVFSPLVSVNGSSPFTVNFGETRFTAKNLDEALARQEQH